MRRISLLVLTLVLTFTLSSQNTCNVCQDCIDCSPAVMADSYIDEIHALLAKNIPGIGAPLRIKRTQKGQTIEYAMGYSKGLYVELKLHLENMQIELIKYSQSE